MLLLLFLNHSLSFLWLINHHLNLIGVLTLKAVGWAAKSSSSVSVANLIKVYCMHIYICVAQHKQGQTRRDSIYLETCWEVVFLIFMEETNISKGISDQLLLWRLKESISTCCESRMHYLLSPLRWFTINWLLLHYSIIYKICPPRPLSLLSPQVFKVHLITRFSSRLLNEVGLLFIHKL